MKGKLNILFTAPLPPPAGGISTHIWRLNQLLKNDFNIDFIDEAKVTKNGYYNIRSFNLITYLKKIIKADILFIHTGSKVLRKIHLAIGRLLGKKIILTLHSYSTRKPMPFRAIDSAFFRLANRIILVNPDIFDKVSLPVENCIVKPAFLPPLMKDEPELPAMLNEWIINARRKNKVVICANASKLYLHNNVDLYGLDMCIEVTKRILEKGFRISFIYVVSSLGNCAGRFHKYAKQIADLNLQEHFLLLNEKLSFVKLIEQADIVLRPTNTDGDALTIREAIYLGKPILASDVVERPKGTILFATRDIEDMESKLEYLIISDRSKRNTCLNETETINNDFKQYYSSLIKSVFAESPVLYQYKNVASTDRLRSNSVCKEKEYNL